MSFNFYVLFFAYIQLIGIIVFRMSIVSEFIDSKITVRWVIFSSTFNFNMILKTCEAA